MFEAQMLSIKVQIAIFLYRVGIRKVLPSSYVNQIKIKENHDQLVDIKPHKSFFWGENLQNKEKVFLRATVYQKLCELEKILPENYHFKIYSAYRSQVEQQALWNKRYQEIASQNPTLSAAELEQRTRHFCANPQRGFGGHQTGGAIDIGLCHSDGSDYALGTKQSEVNQKTPSQASNLTKEEKRNRKILFSVMEQGGFVNYPQEWWHFSYGDRLWAAYKHKKYCIYGLATEN